MKIKARFPINARNRKAIREAILLDTTGNSFESRIFGAAEQAASAEQKVYVTRSYGPGGRFAVVVTDDPSSGGKRMERRKALQAMLARFRV